MRGIIIGYDVDNTMADTDLVVAQILKKEHGIHTPRSSLDTYKLERDGKISHERMVEIYEQAWSDHKKIPLVDKSIPKIIRKLNYEFGFASNVITCTAAKEDVLENWLDLNMIPRSRTIHLANALEKGLFGGIDVHVDDHPDVAVAASRMGKTTILLEGPCSRDFIASNKDPSIIVASNWKEIEEILTSDRIVGLRPKPQVKIKL